MGIGARVTATCDDQSQVRVISLGEGFITQNTTTAWFGLKECQKVDRLTIQWPSGLKQELKNLETNQKINIIEKETPPDSDDSWPKAS